MVENASYIMFLELHGRPNIPLDLGQVYLLGKNINEAKKSNNYIELKEEEDLNQRHCVIEITHSEEAFVFDLLSLRGTLLNNKLLKSLEKTRLKNGDILKLGNQEIKYVCSGHELSRDSSGFLDANKNMSGIIASSPNTPSRLDQCVTGVNYNFLVPVIQPRKSGTPNKSLSSRDIESHNSQISSTSSLSTSSRRSDSFTIPETQYCRQRNSLNASDVSAVNNPNEDGEKINFKFGKLNSFDDDEFCIPETQEVLHVGTTSSSQRRSNNSINQNETQEKTSLEENNLGSSQFRICTQDYNEGFGEEESEQDMSSQIIPFIKHTLMIGNNNNNNTIQCENENSGKQTENEMSELKVNNTKVDQDTLILGGCPTPDLFDFEDEQQSVKSNKIKSTTDLKVNLLDEDEEDFLPTQAIPPQFIAKAADIKNSNQPEKPCLEEDNEEVLTLSDKENRSPISLEAINDIPLTQLLESRSNASSTTKSNKSAINSNTTSCMQKNNRPKSFLNIESDEEDNLLTQAFLQPPEISISSSRSDDKVITKIPDTTSLKEISLASGFKMPDKDLSVLKKNLSASTSDTDLDLLMCTPQLIKDNMYVGKTEDLKQNILAAKNNLFGNETDEEEDDDNGGDLVKLINIPKDSLDFDKLLPHLNKRLNCNKISEEQRAATEAQKLRKFNFLFDRKLDGKQPKTSVSKMSASSVFSRDERHHARDREKEITEHQPRTKSKKKPFKGTVDLKKDAETKEIGNTDKASNEKKTVITGEKVEEKLKNDQKKVTHGRKKHTSSKITVKEKQSPTDDNMKKTPVRRVTRMMSKLDEQTTKEVVDKGTKTTTAVKPIVRVRRCRSNSKTNGSQDSATSNNASHKNESFHRQIEHDGSLHGNDSANVTTKSKEVVTQKPPVKAVAPNERKRLRNSQSQQSVTSSEAPKQRKRSRSSQSQDSKTSSSVISISMTMVDQELFKNLVNNSKGLWNISKNPEDSDILVMDKPFRTFKFLMAMARGIPIVTSEYLKKLNETKSAKRLKISDYLFTDEEFEKTHKFSLAKSLQHAKGNKIFKGYEFLMTSNILPNPQEIKAIIEASGGYVHHKNPPEPKENQQLYLVTSKEDKKDWHKYRRLNKNIVIVSTEAIMSAVMCQNCERIIKYNLA